MPTLLHEALIKMFQDRPAMAAELLDAPLHGVFPRYDEARLSSADLTEVAPTEYRADAVVTFSEAGTPVMAVVIEVQLRPDAKKKLSRPAYVANLRARIDCPVALLVLCPTPRVAAWADGPIPIGPPQSMITPRGARAGPDPGDH